MGGIKSFHKDDRNEFFFWYDQGKPRNENIFETMKETSKIFKQGLKLCEKNKLQIKIEKCINLYSIMCGNKSLFWRKII